MQSLSLIPPFKFEPYLCASPSPAPTATHHFPRTDLQISVPPSVQGGHPETPQSAAEWRGGRWTSPPRNWPNGLSCFNGHKTTFRLNGSASVYCLKRGSKTDVNAAKTPVDDAIINMDDGSGGSCWRKGRVGCFILSVSEQAEAGAHSDQLQQTVTSFSYVIGFSFSFFFVGGLRGLPQVLLRECANTNRSLHPTSSLESPHVFFYWNGLVHTSYDILRNKSVWW